mmetsp:Transcript_32221/g.55712  ORF Transcript_32221/g.55712 Transcript_32221/m.55712 type:complete len:99 (+) Transcript_32221:522-818(+)
MSLSADMSGRSSPDIQVPKPTRLVTAFLLIPAIHLLKQTTFIGKLTRMEREERVRRYKEKRLSRIKQQHVRYKCRKELAERRIRVKGRFARTPDPQVS